jgi:UDP-N-acetylmuramoyl-L-alanyl-D-glutamate--2,6-diaminopimelate ligase
VQVCSAVTPRLSLRTLLPQAEILGADDIQVDRCVCDSRLVGPGDLFVAIRGCQQDGRQFIPDAVARGAAAVLCQEEAISEGDSPIFAARKSGQSPKLHLSPFPDVPVCLVPNARDAYGRICQGLAGNPSFRLKVIGITGTNGKTTTSCLVASVLRKAAYRVGLLGTLGYFDGDDVEPATHTTPPAAPLAMLLARMLANECSHAVMEISSRALSQSRVAGMRLDAACVTNVSRDHLDGHPTIQDYRLAKSKIFDHLAPEGFAVINADDPVAAAYLRRLDGPALSVGIHRPAEITATPLEQCPSEQTFLLTAGSETVPVRTRMIGVHHIYNCLTAAAVGLAYGIDLVTVVRGLEAIDYVPGRLERIECGQPFGVFLDWAQTPDALAACLDALRKVTAGRLIAVFGASGDRDRRKRPLMGRAVENAAEVAVLTSDNPRSEDPQEIIAQILEGFQHPQNARVIADRAEAVRWALAEARPGDCVLLAGRGREECRIGGDEPIPLSDRQIAEEWLYQRDLGI